MQLVVPPSSNTITNIMLWYYQSHLRGIRTDHVKRILIESSAICEPGRW